MNKTDIHPKMISGVMAAFAADSQALGVHWVYDVVRIKAALSTTHQPNLKEDTR